MACGVVPFAVNRFLEIRNLSYFIVCLLCAFSAAVCSHVVHRVGVSVRVRRLVEKSNVPCTENNPCKHAKQASRFVVGLLMLSLCVLCCCMDFPMFWVFSLPNLLAGRA